MSEATEKATSQRVNLNTWLSIAGFAVVILGGAMRIGGFEADVEARLKDSATSTTAPIDARLKYFDGADFA